jgi:hypothetical protein
MAAAFDGLTKIIYYYREDRLKSVENLLMAIAFLIVGSKLTNFVLVQGAEINISDFKYIIFFVFAIIIISSLSNIVVRFLNVFIKQKYCNYATEATLVDVYVKRVRRGHRRRATGHGYTFSSYNEYFYPILEYTVGNTKYRAMYNIPLGLMKSDIGNTYRLLVDENNKSYIYLPDNHKITKGFLSNIIPIILGAAIFLFILSKINWG